jgi:hypothetical protein
MKRNSIFSPRKKNHRIRWLSVEEDLRSSVLPQGISAKRGFLGGGNESFDYEADNFITATVASPKAKHISAGSITSLMPKSSKFLQKDLSRKYNCPYYISPEKWSTYNKAPEFDELAETERVVNFYYHMHDQVVEPNPFNTVKEKSHTVKRMRKQLASLPPIRKYKQYLESKRLRLPSFLDLQSPKVQTNL